MPTDELPPDDPHRRPEGVDDATVAAVGKVTEALEWVERETFCERVRVCDDLPRTRALGASFTGSATLSE